MLARVISAYVSCTRVEDFLNQEETGKYSNITTDSTDGGPRVGFKGATLSYASKEEVEKDNSLFCLRDLSLDFPEGELSIIAGSVGSGKVSLSPGPSRVLTLTGWGCYRPPFSSRSSARRASTPARSTSTLTSPARPRPSTPRPV